MTAGTRSHDFLRFVLLLCFCFFAEEPGHHYEVLKFRNIIFLIKANRLFSVKAVTASCYL